VQFHKLIKGIFTWTSWVLFISTAHKSSIRGKSLWYIRDTKVRSKTSWSCPTQGVFTIYYLPFIIIFCLFITVRQFPKALLVYLLSISNFSIRVLSSSSYQDLGSNLISKTYLTWKSRRPIAKNAWSGFKTTPGKMISEFKFVIGMGFWDTINFK